MGITGRVRTPLLSMPGLLTKDGITDLLQKAQKALIKKDAHDLGFTVVAVCSEAVDWQAEKASVLTLACFHSIPRVSVFSVHRPGSLDALTANTSSADLEQISSTLSEVLKLRGSDAALTLQDAVRALHDDETANKVIDYVTGLVERAWDHTAMKELIETTSEVKARLKTE